jgi:YlmC/YmxH family sporulation protein
MLLGDLQQKDVINVVDGSKLGRISNLEIDPLNGKILAITVQTNLRLANLFSGNNNIVIPWNQIVKIGGEVIIVNYNAFK